MGEMIGAMTLDGPPPPPALVAIAPPAASFAELYRDRFDEMVRLARMLTGSWDSARDVAQDAFCGLHRRWHDVDSPDAYLRRSVVNGAASLHRRRWRQRRRAVDPEIPLDTTSGLDAAELTDVLATLPPRQRAAIVLRFHLDLPDAEIAQVLGVRPGTVPSLVHRGLATLRIALTDEELPETGAPK